MPDSAGTELVPGKQEYSRSLLLLTLGTKEPSHHSNSVTEVRDHADHWSESPGSKSPGTKRLGAAKLVANWRTDNCRVDRLLRRGDPAHAISEHGCDKQGCDTKVGYAALD